MTTFTVAVGAEWESVPGSDGASDVALQAGDPAAVRWLWAAAAPAADAAAFLARSRDQPLLISELRSGSQSLWLRSALRPTVATVWFGSIAEIRALLVGDGAQLLVGPNMRLRV